MPLQAIPPLPAEAKLKSDSTYAVVGGFGGLGRATIVWMAERGARHILSISRSGGKDLQSQTFISELEAKGVRVAAKTCDVSSLDEIVSVIEEAKRDGLPPIRGVIQSAMVLKVCNLRCNTGLLGRCGLSKHANWRSHQDSLFEKMTLEQWRESLTPKICGSKNLHRSFGNDIDFFILMSSSVCLRGNVGQSNYAAACSFQDTLARRRTTMGVPAWSINIGPVLEVGFVSENPEVAATLKRRGLGTISVCHLLALLNYAIANPMGAGGDPAENVCSIGLLPDHDPNTAEDIGIAERRFAHLVQRDARVCKVEGTSASVLKQLEDVDQFEDAVNIVCSAILQQLGKLIATPAEMLSAAQSLDSYGVDSLVAVELRNWINAYLQANIPLMVLRGTSSIKELANIIAKESQFINSKVVIN
jgi:acyl carrier protein